MNKLWKVILTSLLLLAFFPNAQAVDYEQIEKYKTQFTPLLEKIWKKYKKEKIVDFHNKVKSMIIKLDSKSSLTKKQDVLYNKLTAMYQILEYNVLANYQGPLVITIINDKRCVNCISNTEINDYIRSTDALKFATIKIKDFSDAGVKDYLQNNFLTKLPIIITNKSNESFQKIVDDTWYIKENYSKDTNYNNTFNIWYGYNKPFQIDENWHEQITDENYKSLIENTYIRGKENAKYNIIVYSDFECGACQAFNSSSKLNKIEESLGSQVNIRYIAHPMSYHDNAEALTEALEYIWDRSGNKEYYKAIAAVYKSEDYTVDTLYTYAESIWLDIETMKTSVENSNYSWKINNQKWDSYFVWLSWLTHVVAIHPESNSYIKLRYYNDAETIIKSILTLDISETD